MAFKTLDNRQQRTVISKRCEINKMNESYNCPSNTDKDSRSQARERRLSQIPADTTDSPGRLT